MAEWRCCVRVWDRAERRASFSGFGGMGGAEMLVSWGSDRMGLSKGEERRSSGGLGAAGGCLGVYIG